MALSVVKSQDIPGDVVILNKFTFSRSHSESHKYLGNNIYSTIARTHDTGKRTHTRLENSRMSDTKLHAIKLRVQLTVTSITESMCRHHHPLPITLVYMYVHVCVYVLIQDSHNMFFPANVTDIDFCPARTSQYSLYCTRHIFVYTVHITMLSILLMWRTSMSVLRAYHNCVYTVHITILSIPHASHYCLSLSTWPLAITWCENTQLHTTFQSIKFWDSDIFNAHYMATMITIHAKVVKDHLLFTILGLSTSCGNIDQYACM
jgi:hypothetical protein